MSEKDKNILGAFLLARHKEELTNEEIKDVQQAIKRVWNNFDKAIEYIKTHSRCGGSIINGKFIIEQCEEIYNGMELLKILMGDRDE